MLMAIAAIIGILVILSVITRFNFAHSILQVIQRALLTAPRDCSH